MNRGVQTAAEADRARGGIGDKATQCVGPEHTQENSQQARTICGGAQGTTGDPGPNVGVRGDPVQGTVNALRALTARQHAASQAQPSTQA